MRGYGIMHSLRLSRAAEERRRRPERGVCHTENLALDLQAFSIVTAPRLTPAPHIASQPPSLFSDQTKSVEMHDPHLKTAHSSALLDDHWLNAFRSPRSNPSRKLQFTEKEENKCMYTTYLHDENKVRPPHGQQTGKKISDTYTIQNK